LSTFSQNHSSAYLSHKIHTYRETDINYSTFYGAFTPYTCRLSQAQVVAVYMYPVSATMSSWLHVIHLYPRVEHYLELVSVDM